MSRTSWQLPSDVNAWCCSLCGIMAFLPKSGERQAVGDTQDSWIGPFTRLLNLGKSPWSHTNLMRLQCQKGKKSHKRLVILWFLVRLLEYLRHRGDCAINFEGLIELGFHNYEIFALPEFIILDIPTKPNCVHTHGLPCGKRRSKKRLILLTPFPFQCCEHRCSNDGGQIVWISSIQNTFQQSFETPEGFPSHLLEIA